MQRRRRIRKAVADRNCPPNCPKVPNPDWECKPTTCDRAKCSDAATYCLTAIDEAGAFYSLLTCCSCYGSVPFDLFVFLSCFVLFLDEDFVHADGIGFGKGDIKKKKKKKGKRNETKLNYSIE